MPGAAVAGVTERERLEPVRTEPFEHGLILVHQFAMTRYAQTTGPARRWWVVCPTARSSENRSITPNTLESDVPPLNSNPAGGSGTAKTRLSVLGLVASEASDVFDQRVKVESVCWRRNECSTSPFVGQG
jgi:hypothetical protein